MLYITRGPQVPELAGLLVISCVFDLPFPTYCNFWIYQKVSWVCFIAKTWHFVYECRILFSFKQSYFIIVRYIERKIYLFMWRPKISRFKCQKSQATRRLQAFKTRYFKGCCCRRRRRRCCCCCCCCCCVVWGPESGCTAACRLIVHTPCVFSVPTFTARRLHVTTTMEILAAKGATLLGEKRPVIWPKVASSTLL
jgi:hypothetical protein